MGTVAGIFIAAATTEPVVARDEVTAVAGRGLAGDRHFHGGDDDADHDPADEITLIAAEGLEKARIDHGLELDPGEHRRNVVVEGVDLLALVGRTVRVGGAEVAVLEDNPGCRTLQNLVGKPVLRGLRRHGGVRGQIVTGGVIRVGDAVAPADPDR
jgi:MOSC domain-containing protein YiiM